MGLGNRHIMFLPLTTLLALPESDMRAQLPADSTVAPNVVEGKTELLYSFYVNNDYLRGDH